MLTLSTVRDNGEPHRCVMCDYMTQGKNKICSLGLLMCACFKCSCICSKGCETSSPTMALEENRENEAGLQGEAETRDQERDPEASVLVSELSSIPGLCVLNI